MPPTPQKFTEYLTVSQAAEFLGVSPWTLRNWDKAGKLRPVRHPKNGYRIYRHADLRAVLELKDNAAAAMRTPAADWSDVAAAEHFVQFYESDAYLAEAVGGYVAAGLSANEPAIVVATPAHREGIRNSKAMATVDLAAAIADGRYLALDAAEVLEQICTNGQPDDARFRAVVEPILARATAGGRRARVFGELVVLLWNRPNRAAAMRLEELWNETVRKYPFSLFCAYPLSAFPGQTDVAPFADLCDCHARVLPAETYAALPTPDQRAREITRLQQKAAAFDAMCATAR
jgi:excisionase family DNA binding protein